MRIPIVSTLWRAGQYWSSDRASYLGAALAYNALFSIAPLLIIAIAVVGLVYGAEAVQDKILGIAKEYIGNEGALAIKSLVEQVWQPKTTAWAAIVGPAVLFIMACNFYLQLETALHMIWNLPIQKPQRWFYPFLRSYLIAFVMVLLSSCFIFVIIVVDGSLSYLIRRVQDQLPGGQWLWYWLHVGLSLALLAMLFLFTFRFMSHRRIGYRALWPGALVAAILFLIGRRLFGWYLNYMGDSLATAFGASSSIVIFLIWVYYSAQIVFYGAEVVKVRLEPAAGTLSLPPAAGGAP
jgi:membrane protein